MSNTIVALSTPPGYGGVAVIRVSGQQTKQICQAVLKKIPSPRQAYHQSFYGKNDEVLDQGLAIFFSRPHSFTGEDVLELQGHGGPVVVDRIIQHIISLGARLAQAGEFSQRAFLNDKMDLTQAEAIADLIYASSEQAAKSAIQSLQGKFSQQIYQLLDQLVHLRMYVEAAIDFPEEEIDFLGSKKIIDGLAALIEKVKQVKQAAQQGRLLQEGMTVVIAGAPNAGKSSLLNSLSEKDSAIVTDIAGTTRDVLRESINIDGMPLHVIDTAGLRESADVVEQEGIKRAKKAMQAADEILWICDVNAKAAIDSDAFPADKPATVIYNKIDLAGLPAKIENVTDKSQRTEIYLSAKHHQGLDLLKEHLKKTIGFQQAEGLFIARRRHLQALDRAEQSLVIGQQQLQQHRAGELLAEDLRQAQKSLNEITGEFTSDDLLGKIFSSFCIGK